ncbi:MAG: DUF4041 domain-containing protein [Candidatus Caenarcaniphilales bacterium]|nr:DUF4041 domain-containing protein [Candidatus Caenarcaniphilales bacterium]
MEMFWVVVVFLAAIGIIYAQNKDLEKYRKYFSEITNLTAETKRLKSLNSSLETEANKSRVQIEEEKKLAKERLLNELTQFKEKTELGKQNLYRELQVLQQEVDEFEQSHLDIFSGLYQAKYDFASSSRYKIEIDKIRAEQKGLIQSGNAVVCHTEWTLAGSRAEGKKHIKDIIKLMLRAFNGECDALIVKTKWNNVNLIEGQIEKLRDSINNLTSRQSCEITYDYLSLKLKELYLVHEYQEKLQEEREEQRRIQEQIREEQRVLKELEKIKEEAEKEEIRYLKALEQAKTELEKASLVEKEKLTAYILEIEEKLRLTEDKKQRAISQAQMTRQGHVYVISNIGSFGENVFKIGMTRRLEPMERVNELGDASVPFPFDVHAIIFSEDAPGLEAKLHRRFNSRMVNRINQRKEFFRVDIKEIEKFVLEHNSKIEFTKFAEAKQFRQSIEMEDLALNSQQVVPRLPIRINSN